MSDAPHAVDHPIDAAEHGTKKAAKGVKGFLSKKVGPLPVGLWIVGVGGGLVLALWLRRAYGGNGATAMDGEYDTPEGTGGAAYSDPSYTGTGGGGFQPDPFDPVEPTDGDAETPTATTNGARQFKDNQAWKRRAIDTLTANGVSYITAVRAIDRYLSGKPLNKRQRALIDSIGASIGAPPKPVPTPPRPHHAATGHGAGQGAGNHGQGGAGQGNAGGGQGGGHGDGQGGNHGAHGGKGGKGHGEDKPNRPPASWQAGTHAQAAHATGPRGPRRHDGKPPKTHGGRR